MKEATTRFIKRPTAEAMQLTEAEGFLFNVCINAIPLQLKQFLCGNKNN